MLGRQGKDNMNTRDTILHHYHHQLLEELRCRLGIMRYVIGCGDGGGGLLPSPSVYTHTHMTTTYRCHYRSRKGIKREIAKKKKRIGRGRAARIA